MMLWIIFFIFSLNKCNAGYKGVSITCVCSTTHCIEHRMQNCNTTGMCFSQYLDRRDGSHPVVRGCISSKTPLLCENRKPAIARGSWPVLLCCNSNMCNRDAVPTAPPWLVQDSLENETSVIHKEQLSGFTERTNLRPAPVHAEISSSNQQETASESSSFYAPSKSKSKSSLPHIVSPVYISVLVLGIISLIIIGIVAAVMLKRSNRFYIEQYGALEHQHEQGYLKQIRAPFPPPVHIHCDCDSEVESLSQCSQSYV
ncbi:hypothetical protein X975_09609, partial [Stegodyphus mimosarum]